MILQIFNLEICFTSLTYIQLFWESLQIHIAKQYEIKYNKDILFAKEIFVGGGATRVTSFELIWRLIVLLLLSNNNDESQETNKD